MAQTKLHQLIASFDRQEAREVGKFLRSPFFNQRKDVVLLFEALSGSSNKGWPDKEKLFAGVYPGKTYHDANFHLLQSYLLKLLEQYLAVKQNREDPFARQYSLMQAYQRRGLPVHLRYAASGLKKWLDRQPRRDSRHYEHLRDLCWEEYQEEVASKPSGGLNLRELSEYTDIAYFSQKLRQICLLTAHQAVYTVDYDNWSRSQQHLFAYLEEQDLIKTPAIGLYYHGYFVLRSNGEESAHFEQFNALLLEHSHRFSEPEVRELYLIAINYCIRRVNMGDRSFFDHMLALYQRGLETGALLENGKLSRFTYHNVVAAALQTRAYEWAKDFLLKYRGQLDEKYQDNSFFYSYARLEYEQGHYDEALTLIHNANFQDVLLNLAAKTITLKIYYALREYDLLDAHLNAMNNFIRRKKVLGYHRENYLNILRYTRKLLLLNFYDKAAVAALRREVEGEKVLTEKDWFFELLAPPSASTK